MEWLGEVFPGDPLRSWAMATAALHAAERFLDLPERVERVSTAVIVVVAWLQAAVWGVAMIEFLLRNRQARLEAEGDTRQSGSLSVLTLVARIAVSAIALLLALDNPGLDTTALVAGTRFAYPTRMVIVRQP